MTPFKWLVLAVLCLIHESKAACGSSESSIRCRDVDEDTAFRNFESTKVLRPERVRMMPKEISPGKVPKLEHIKITDSPEAECSWFKRWSIKITITIIKKRCYHAKRNSMFHYQYVYFTLFRILRNA